MANENNKTRDSGSKRKNRRNYNKRKFKTQNNESAHIGSPSKQNSLESQHSSSITTTLAAPDMLLCDQKQDENLGNRNELLGREVVTPPPQTLLSEHSQKSIPYKSPRKEAISRYKQGHSNAFNQLSDLKENLRSSDTAPLSTQQADLENSDSLSLSLSIDDKVSLFRYKSVEILEIANQNNVNGSLLARGVFEVFQLRGDITFLSCGSTFVYPLLSRTKILRINLNEFMLTLTNPERYYKISLHCEDVQMINNLVGVFQKNIQFIDLYEQDETKESHNIDFMPRELQSPQNEYILNEIPESPPSAPISPLTYMHSPVHFASSNPQQPHLPSLSRFQVPKKVSVETLNSNIASLDINLKLLLHQPKPRRQQANYSTSQHTINNKYTTIEEKSESSMDSLLDEYEQNLNDSAAMVLRPQTRQPSIASAQNLHGFHHSNSNILAQYYPIENKLHNYLRSRRSSRSELYTSETGWMEPNLIQPNSSNVTNCNSNSNVGVVNNGINGKKIPKSRSTYSMNSAVTDLHSIYKNIQLRNSQNRRAEEDSRSIKSMSRLPSSSIITSMPRSELNRRRQSIYGGSISNNVSHKSDVKLDSHEIYKMLSSKPDKPILKQPYTSSPPASIPKSASFTSRLFGW